MISARAGCGWLRAVVLNEELSSGIIALLMPLVDLNLQLSTRTLRGAAVGGGPHH